MITTIQVPSVDFDIAGVPVVLQINIPVHMGFDVNATIGGSLSASVGVNANLAYGVQYIDGSGWGPIYNHSFTPYGSFGNLDTNFYAGFMVWLFPTPILYVDYIGGPYLGFKPFIEAGLYSDPSCTGAMAVLNWGLQITLGINISINFEGFSGQIYNPDPWNIYSTKQPISQGCLNTNYLLGDSPVPGSLVTGNVWSGYYHDNLNYNSATGDVAMQLVSIDVYGNYYIAGSYSLYTQNSGACVIQALFSGALGDDGVTWNFQPVTDDSGSFIFVEDCQFVNPFQPVPWSASFSSDNSTLTTVGNTSGDPIILYRDPSNLRSKK